MGIWTVIPEASALLEVPANCRITVLTNSLSKLLYITWPVIPFFTQLCQLQVELAEFKSYLLFGSPWGSGVHMPSERGVDVPSERGVDVPSERGVDVPSERGVDVFSERGILLRGRVFFIV